MTKNRSSKRLVPAVLSACLLLAMGLTPVFAECIPQGATIESATLFIYADVPSGETVNLHLVNASWDEHT